MFYLQELNKTSPVTASYDAKGGGRTDLSSLNVYRALLSRTEMLAYGKRPRILRLETICTQISSGAVLVET